MGQDASTPATAARTDALAGFLVFLRRHRLVVIGCTAVALLLGLAAVLFLPPRYTARTVVMPAEQVGGGLLSALAGQGLGGSLPFGLGSLGGSLPVLQGIVESETVADEMSVAYSLDERYGRDRREDRLRIWYDRLDAGVNDQGLLEIRFTDRDPELAAEIAGRLVTLLDERNRELRASAGNRAEEFLEIHRRELVRRMGEVEEELVDLQKSGGLAVPSGSEAMASAGASLLAERMRLEMEREILRENLSPDAPALREAELRLRALDSELAALPEMTSRLARLVRDLEAMERAYAYVTAQLEEARLEAARSTPTLQVIDPPAVPERRSWPRPLRTLALAGVLGLGIGLAAGRLKDAARTAGGDRGAHA
jgi:uncharacterized protein involved in exopolysaccharide biosynthesis